MVYKSFDKKTRLGAGARVNEQLAEEFHKSVIKKFSAIFKDNIWEKDLAEMGSLSSKKKHFKYILCVIVFSLNMHGLNL